MRGALLLSTLGISLLAIAGFATLEAGQARAQATVAVGVDNYYFCEQSFDGGVCEKTISAGDTVKWEFAAGPHTVTQCIDAFTVCPSAGGFDSGRMNQGQDFSRTFNTPGAYAYRCNVHPDEMRGRITVLAPATPTPSPLATPAVTPVPTAASPTPRTVARAGGAPGGDDVVPWAALVTALGAGLLLASMTLTWRGLRRG